jgi:hypothetical protein
VEERPCLSGDRGYTAAVDHILKDVEALTDTKRKRERGKAPLL